MSNNNSITREKGDTKRISLTMRDKSGSIIPINTWTNFRMSIDINETPIDDDNDIHLATGSFTTTGTDGKFYFPVNGTLEKGTYYYEMKAVNGSGETVTISSGLYIVTLHGTAQEEEQDFELTNGESFYIGWRFKWDETTPQDITGYNVLIQLKPFPRSRRSITQWTQTSTDLIIIPASGIVDLTIPASTTSLYTFNEAYLDCLLTHPTNGLGFRSNQTKIVNNSGVSRNGNN